MPAVSISETFLIPNSPFSKTVFEMSLMPNTQEDEGNWFSKMGLIGMTKNGQNTSHPIQKILKVGEQQGKEFRSYLAGYLVGDPDVGDGVASETSQSLGRRFFDFTTVAVYSVSLDVPDDQLNREQAVPIIQDYSRAYREYWGNLVEEFTMTIGLASMRGQSDNYEVMEALQDDSENAAQAVKESFTKTMRGLAEANPIYPPQLQFASWHTSLNPSNPLNPSGASADDVMTFSDMRAISTWLKEQNRRLRGVAMQPGTMSLKSLKSGNSNAKNAKMNDWIWMIPPSVKRALYDATGSDTMSEYQLALVQSEGHNTGIEDFSIGKLFDMLFVEYRKVPRYFGGTNKDVPIARTMILGRQACCFGVRTRSIPPELTARFNQRSRRFGSWGVPVKTWVKDVNEGRRAKLHGQANMGISALYWTDPRDGVRVDKGRIAYDCAVPVSFNSII